MWLSLIELWLAQELRLEDPMRSLLWSTAPTRKVPVSSQSAAETEPYVVVSSKSYGLASENLLRLNAILKLWLRLQELRLIDRTRSILSADALFLPK